MNVFRLYVFLMCFWPILGWAQEESVNGAKTKIYYNCQELQTFIVRSDKEYKSRMDWISKNGRVGQKFGIIAKLPSRTVYMRALVGKDNNGDGIHNVAVFIGSITRDSACGGRTLLLKPGPAEIYPEPE